jgi:hypothetical protein
MKLPPHLHIPAAIVLGCGIIATSLAFAFGPAEYHGQIAAGVASAWALVQAFVRPLLLSGGE